LVLEICSFFGAGQDKVVEVWDASSTTSAKLSARGNMTNQKVASREGLFFLGGLEGASTKSAEFFARGDKTNRRWLTWV
jgi:hypothetical protein